MILQFGAGRFLRGFFDRFVSEAGHRHAITVVQSTPGRRAELMNTHAADGYPVAIRGLRAGETVDETVQVTSLKKAIVAADNWAGVLAAACEPGLQLIVSNGTEAAYVLDESGPSGVPKTLPGKLAAALVARNAAGREPVTILPCELIDRNAEKLKDLVLQQIALWKQQDARGFVEACDWRCNLVDCIIIDVPDDDPLAANPLAVQAEPFALLAVEGGPLPIDHAAIRQVDDLAPIALAKVRVLNGVHTAMVAKFSGEHGDDSFATVQEALADETARDWVRSVLMNEIVPVIEDRVDDAKGFAATTLERFANPFLSHKLSDIALNHEAKIETRLRPTMQDYETQFGKPAPLLSAALGEERGQRRD